MSLPLLSPTVYQGATTRGLTQTCWLTSYHSFSFGDYHDPNWHHFGPLRVLNDDIVAPSGGFGTHPHRDMEIVTLVLSGALEHRDSLGNGSVIKAGDIQRMSAGTGITHSEFNPSETEAAHFLQVWFFPRTKGLTPSYAQATPEVLPNTWTRIAAPDTDTNAVNAGILTLHQNVSIFQLKAAGDGEIPPLPLPAGAHVWLQVATGELTVTGEHHPAGDGLGWVSDGEPLVVSASQPATIFAFVMNEAE